MCIIIIESKKVYVCGSLRGVHSGKRVITIPNECTIIWYGILTFSRSSSLVTEAHIHLL